jgi:diguanylate cyclase (GGDEF)-like protein
LLLEELAAQTLAYAHRHEIRVAFLFVDVDGFKIINDTHGHQFGDMVLERIAKRLKSSIRAQDVVVRHGGDEFIVILTDISDVQAAGDAAGRILNSMSRSYNVGQIEMKTTVSIGISIYPDDASHLEGLVRNADAAMYRAKATGRGTFSYYAPDMAPGASDRTSLEYGLFRALDQQEFTIDYQPQIDISSGRIIGAEALVRWQHPQLGLIGPANFIPLAEETGLIVPLGEWVMKTALAQMYKWHRLGHVPIRIAVNLSAIQISQVDFPARIARVLGESELDSRYLELEITESALMRNIEPNIERLRMARKLGISFALDDFGTGYSSLSYLRQLPIERLKMDVSFVRGLTTDPGGEILVKAIIGLAKSLGLKVLAEGVETREQFNLLQSNGCDEMQGYLFSAPLHEDAFEAMLADGRTLTV